MGLGVGSSVASRAHRIDLIKWMYEYKRGKEFTFSLFFSHSGLSGLDDVYPHWERQVVFTHSLASNANLFPENLPRHTQVYFKSKLGVHQPNQDDTESTIKRATRLAPLSPLQRPLRILHF